MATENEKYDAAFGTAQRTNHMPPIIPVNTLISKEIRSVSRSLIVVLMAGHSRCVHSRTSEQNKMAQEITQGLVDLRLLNDLNVSQGIEAEALSRYGTESDLWTMFKRPKSYALSFCPCRILRILPSLPDFCLLKSTFLHCHILLFAALLPECLPGL